MSIVIVLSKLLYITNQMHDISTKNLISKAKHGDATEPS